MFALKRPRVTHKFIRGKKTFFLIFRLFKKTFFDFINKKTSLEHLKKDYLILNSRGYICTCALNAKYHLEAKINVEKILYFCHNHQKLRPQAYCSLSFLSQVDFFERSFQKTTFFLSRYNQSHTILLSLWMQWPIIGVQMSHRCSALCRVLSSETIMCRCKRFISQCKQLQWL